MARLSIFLLGVALAALMAPASGARLGLFPGLSSFMLGSEDEGVVLEPTDLAFSRSRVAMDAANMRANLQQLAAKAGEVVREIMPAAVPDMSRRSLMQTDYVGSDPVGSDTVGSDTVGSDPCGNGGCGNGGSYGGGYGNYGGYYGSSSASRRLLEVDIDDWEILEA